MSSMYFLLHFLNLGHTIFKFSSLDDLIIHVKFQAML